MFVESCLLRLTLFLSRRLWMVVLMLPAKLSEVFFHFVAETTRT